MDYEARQLQRKKDLQSQTERDQEISKEQVLTPDLHPKMSLLPSSLALHLKEP